MKKLFFLFILFCFNANAQIVNIPDTNFKNKLIMLGVDTSGDGEIQQSEALAKTSLDVQYSSISSLEGIQSFTNLTTLRCNNNQLSALNVSNLTQLTELSCGKNQITALNVLNLTNLYTLNCSKNLFTSLDVSNLTNLYTLTASDLNATYGQLTSLNASGCSNLNTIYADHNYLTNLNVSGCRKLKYLYAINNQLTTADVSDCIFLTELHLANNTPLNSIFVKNGVNETLHISGNPNLKYICTDQSQMSQIQLLINQNGYTTCQLNTYCSFTNGGDVYTIQGNNKLDSNNNGCEASDLSLANLKFNFTNGTNSGSVVSNTSGDYSIPVQAGTHTITPVLENPSYFNVSPPSVNVTFPTESSPLVRNFCITPNGPHKDLEITLLPLQSARPGFDVKYKIIYKNKGTTVQSGSVELDHFNNLVEFVSSNPAVTSATPTVLTWNYSNLQPLEIREITFTVNVNSPMEIPAVNNGDYLSFQASVYPVAGDLIANDNRSNFRQIVVGSYDPNDKTCLEGTSIAPEKVGEYVHYMIRFENTGTFAAENVVVKDMIDTAKFDINSLVPMKGSHSYVTNISSGNKVEFIFENINLPFDDANNDGYVAFKIKTNPTLVLGDTFSNTASIYFDYNFPIITNTAATTIAVLSVQDFEFSNYFSLYPNPVSDVLNIVTKESIKISSINIYNTLGQLVLVIPNANDIKKVDVSSLTSGNYFIKINSDKGTSNTKFIKN